MPRRYLSCDRCEAAAWIGPAGDRTDAWCEACQRATQVPAGVEAPGCGHCGQPLTLGAPRFEELFGELQNLVAVLEAWLGDPTRLAPLKPDRPHFLADLDPPAPRGDDDPPARAALAALETGGFADAGEWLEALVKRVPGGAPGRPLGHLWRGLGIARQRLGDLAAAERAFSRALELDPDDRKSRLDRGALRARRGALGEARDDFAAAGEGYEARWNRAALRVLEAVATGTGLPDAQRLAEARALASPPSAFWSDHTVGRLLFTLLVERAHSRGVDACADARALRAAEGELEFETFDDRALVLHGYAALGLAAEAEAVAAPLAAGIAERIASEPCARGPAGSFLELALATAAHESRAQRPAAALAAVAPLLARADLRRYRVPCARCARGTVGVERVEDERSVESARAPGED